uniref:FeS_assembly_P domain-containing protein n=1 Tax=Parastrongyloides trichosuri TaxID=131310 RepID=A0A0N4Z6H1_PARTI
MVKEGLDNVAPKVYDIKDRAYATNLHNLALLDDEPISAEEVFEYIRDINDPEHPYTLEQLNVVQEELILVDNDEYNPYVDVRFTPTIPHCSMATLIGLCIRIKLERSLPPGMKIITRITAGTHNSEETINKQLADKERVAAALENHNLMTTVNNCLKNREY